MPGWVEQHPPPIRCRLFGCPARSQPKRFSLCLVQVVYGKIEVHLLGGAGARPRRGLVIWHSDRSQPRSISLDRDEVVAAESDLAADELRPESRESSRVSTVQRYGRQASYSHSMIVAARHRSTRIP